MIDPVTYCSKKLAAVNPDAATGFEDACRKSGIHDVADVTERARIVRDLLITRLHAHPMPTDELIAQIRKPNWKSAFTNRAAVQIDSLMIFER